MPFTATATGFGSCGTISFHWDDGQPLGTADSGATDPATNSVAAKLAVPDDASTGAHKVIASCVGGENTAWFTVVATENKPTLTLAPEKGNPGTTVTATITGYGGCHDNQPRVAFIPAISLQWDDKSLTPSRSSTVNGDKVWPSASRCRLTLRPANTRWSHCAGTRASPRRSPSSRPRTPPSR